MTAPSTNGPRGDAVDGHELAPRQERTSITTRPRVRPSRISSPSAGTRSSGSTTVISSSSAGGRPVASRSQACRRSASGARTDSTPAKRHASEDERVHGRRQLGAARQPASRDAASVSGLAEHRGERRAADGVDAAEEPLLVERARSSVGELGPGQDLGGTEPAQVRLVLGPAAHGGDLVAELGQQRDGHAARRRRPRR